MSPERTKEGFARELDSVAANRLLGEILSDCHMEPNSIPVDVLENWGNYEKPRFRIAYTLLGVALAVVLLLPALFLKPAIYAGCMSVTDSLSAQYSIRVVSLLPVKHVLVDLDGRFLPVIRGEDDFYNVEVDDNGQMTVRAMLWGGQYNTRSYDIRVLDRERPQLVEYTTEGYALIITVRDTFSGVDYDKIEGYQPQSWDKDTGRIIFPVSTETVNVTIPDRCGNKLVLELKPQ